MVRCHTLGAHLGTGGGAWAPARARHPPGYGCRSEAAQGLPDHCPRALQPALTSPLPCPAPGLLSNHPVPMGSTPSAPLSRHTRDSGSGHWRSLPPTFPTARSPQLCRFCQGCVSTSLCHPTSQAWWGAGWESRPRPPGLQGRRPFGTQAETHREAVGTEDTAVSSTDLSQEGGVDAQVFGDQVEAEEVSVDPRARHGQAVHVLVLLRGFPEEVLQVRFLGAGSAAVTSSSDPRSGRGPGPSRPVGWGDAGGSPCAPPPAWPARRPWTRSCRNARSRCGPRGTAESWRLRRSGRTCPCPAERGRVSRWAGAWRCPAPAAPGGGPTRKWASCRAICTKASGLVRHFLMTPLPKGRNWKQYNSTSSASALATW